MKIYANDIGYMVSWWPLPDMVKTLKNVLLQNLLEDSNETWYLA